MTLRLLHLYPRELGINGDLGNVTVLRKRAEWCGIELEVIDHHPGDRLPRTVDIVHMGSGSHQGQLAVHADLVQITPRLREWKQADVPFLAIAAGWQLLGRQVTTVKGESLPGAGVFSTSVTLTSGRRVGEVVLDTARGRVAGFENHGSVAVLHERSSPLGTVVRFGGKTEPGAVEETPRSVEGVVDGSSVGTNLHGPFLPLNPLWADELLASALMHSGLGDDEARARLAAGDDAKLRVADHAAAQARLAIYLRLGLDQAESAS